MSWADSAKEEHTAFLQTQWKQSDGALLSLRKIIKARYKESEDPYNFDLVLNLQNNQEGTCPACKAKGTWKSEGRANEKTVSMHFYVAMPYKGTGAVIRYCECGKTILPPRDFEFTASEKFYINEVARQYFYDKRIQKDYHKIGLADDYWDDRNYFAIWTGRASQISSCVSWYMGAAKRHLPAVLRSKGVCRG